LCQCHDTDSTITLIGRVAFEKRSFFRKFLEMLEPHSFWSSVANPDPFSEQITDSE
jgi:hypothetical protein